MEKRWTRRNKELNVTVRLFELNKKLTIIYFPFYIVRKGRKGGEGYAGERYKKRGREGKLNDFIVNLFV